MLTDKFGRTITYLRLAVIDRCNLRCTYCMPEHGLAWLNRTELMSLPEMARLCGLFAQLGVEKFRITGGEPFLRKDLLPFLQQISQLTDVREITITTNGLLTAKYIPELTKLGIRSVNLSLDSLNDDRFFQITRRRELSKVLHTPLELLAHDIQVKINTVVIGRQNMEDILPLVDLTRTLPVSVRFIEEMPFNGDTFIREQPWTAQQIVDYIQQHHPTLIQMQAEPHATSERYKIPGYRGDIGVIAAFTRSFCGDCNRLRLTPTGVLRTCLYQSDGINLKDSIRSGKTDLQLIELIKRAVMDKAKDGWAAEKESRSVSATNQSMAMIGG